MLCWLYVCSRLSPSCTDNKIMHRFIHRITFVSFDKNKWLFEWIIFPRWDCWTGLISASLPLFTHTAGKQRKAHDKLCLQCGHELRTRKPHMHSANTKRKSSTEFLPVHRMNFNAKSTFVYLLTNKCSELMQYSFGGERPKEYDPGESQMHCGQPTRLPARFRWMRLVFPVGGPLEGPQAGKQRETITIDGQSGKLIIHRSERPLI